MSSSAMVCGGYAAGNSITIALVWADMHTLPRRPGSRLRALGLVLAVLSVPALAACSSLAAPASPSPVSPAPSEDPNASVGIDLPAPSDDPALIDPPGRTVVVPKPGQLDVQAIPAETLSATVAGRRVTLAIDYTSGVEPCYVLDSIVVAVGDGGTFAITLRQGHGPEDVACIEIAEAKRTIVELGELAPGTYTISDTTGGAAPITVTIA
jgi:hypothetical protein